MDIPQTIGRYQVQRLLGYGGMAVVFLARDPFMDRLVAIKVLPRQLTFNDDLRQRFYREARIIAALEHPAIVPIHDFGEHEQQPYLVMRYMAGGSLRNRLEQPLSLRDTYAIFERLAPALDKAHERGVIHRDLKPDNVLFDEDGLPYLADFGVARLADATQTMTVAGTPSFMSPEQIQGNQTLDGRCDIYALGVMLYLMLSGEPPFEADTPPKLMFKHVYEPVPDIRVPRTDLPPDIQSIVERAMAKDADERYATAGELAQALEALMDAHRASFTTAVEEAPPTFVSPLADSPAQVKETVPDARAAHPERSPQERAEPHLEQRGLKRSTPAWIWPLLALLGLALLFWGGSLLLAGEEPAEATPSTVASDTAMASTPTPASAPAVPPADAQSGDNWTRPADGATMVFAPGGSFLMGSSEGDPRADDDELPRHDVTLDGFWIDRTEVSQVQYALCVDDGVCQEAVYGDDERFSGDNLPIVGVTWADADAYCRWAGAQLPSEAQWEYAARGPEALRYPWGDDLPTCDLAQYATCEGETVLVDALPLGVSWIGALNMAGNAWEWVLDWHQDYYYDTGPADNPPGPTYGLQRVLRGGGWTHVQSLLRAANRYQLDPEETSASTGFRCAAVPGE